MSPGCHRTTKCHGSRSRWLEGFQGAENGNLTSVVFFFFTAPKAQLPARISNPEAKEGHSCPVPRLGQKATRLACSTGVFQGQMKRGHVRRCLKVWTRCSEG